MNPEHFALESEPIPAAPSARPTLAPIAHLGAPAFGQSARAGVTVETYAGPFPRARHAHRCRRCGSGRSFYCYRAQCAKGRNVDNCQFCR